MSVSDLFCEHCGKWITWVYPSKGWQPATKQIGFCSTGCREAYLKDLDGQIEETKARITVLGNLTLGELTEEQKQEYVDLIQKVIDLLKIRVDL